MFINLSATLKRVAAAWRARRAPGSKRGTYHLVLFAQRRNDNFSYTLLACNNKNKTKPQKKTVMLHPFHLACATHPHIPSFYKLIFHTFFNKKKKVLML